MQKGAKQYDEACVSGRDGPWRAGGRRHRMAVTAKSMQSPDVRRMARRAVRKMDHMKDDLADTLGL